MRDDARAAAAIDILDEVLAGRRAEVALTRWARAHRFAGSKDRAAIRDIVFEVLRRRGSCAVAGGGLTGRGLVLGWARLSGRDPASVMTGQGYGPPGLSAQEVALCGTPLPAPDPWRDLPDWLVPALKCALGGKADAYARAMQDRAPVFLRVNALKTNVDSAAAALAREGIGCEPAGGWALRVTENARRIAASTAYVDGWVELQDAASQALVAALPPARRVLDYCAGGGGKALALAARDGTRVFAWDVDPARMADIPARAARAGARIEVLPDPAAAAPYDLVLCDAPCSGTGSWRRDPEGRWRLTTERLDALLQTQAAILDAAAPLVAPGGVLAYATCSVLHAENAEQVAAFLDRQGGGWARQDLCLHDFDRGDGFGLSILTRANS